MKTIFYKATFLIFMFMGDAVIFEFNAKSSIEKWTLLDDVVMGGKSGGDFFLRRKGLVYLRGQFLLKTTEDFHRLDIRILKLIYLNILRL